MNQSNSQQPPDEKNKPEKANSNEFTTLAKVIETVSQGRSDGVAIFGMFSLVIVFISMIIGGVYIHSNATQTNNNQPVQQESISEEKRVD